MGAQPSRCPGPPSGPGLRVEDSREGFPLVDWLTLACLLSLSPADSPPSASLCLCLSGWQMTAGVHSGVCGGVLQLSVKLHLLPLHACLSTTSCISQNRCTAVRKKDFGKQGEASLIKHQKPPPQRKHKRGGVEGGGGACQSLRLSVSEWPWSRRRHR